MGGESKRSAPRRPAPLAPPRLRRRSFPPPNRSPVSDLARQQVAAEADPIVVKVGTRVLANPTGELNEERIEQLVEQLVAIGAGAGRRVVLVSSGAVGAGIGRLGLPNRPTDLASLQAIAAIGQSRLLEAYNRALGRHGRHAAQVLLTADDVNDRRRYLNVRNTLRSLFDYDAVPIVNENDTVRTEELARNVGDNDRLAAMVANLLHAPLLVILSDVEGLYDGDPADAASSVIPMVDAIDDEAFALATGGAKSGPVLSRGGMTSKLEAAQMVTSAGNSVILASGRRPNVLVDILAGETVGTLFIGQGALVSARKRWIGWAAQPLGQLVLDAGAVEAVEETGSSLLPVGITRVAGDFCKGDVVSIEDGAGEEIARGLSNYDAAELRLIAGQATDGISDILGRMPYVEAVHRDDLTLIRRVDDHQAG